MASNEEDFELQQTMSFQKMLMELMKKAAPVPNDERQKRYCRYVNSLLSFYGEERCVLVGSTVEGTRLRSNEDEGDFDYLMISATKINRKHLCYRDDLPCFVRIDGRDLQEQLPVDLIDGKYLPSYILKTVSTEAFKGLRGIFAIVSLSSTYHGRHTPHITISSSNKPGLTLTNYADWMCDALPVPRGTASLDKDAVYSMFQKKIGKSQILLDMDNDVINVFKKLAHLVKTLHKEDEPGARMLQYIGPLLLAVADNVGSEKRASDMTDTESSKETSCCGKASKGNISSHLETCRQNQNDINVSIIYERPTYIPSETRGENVVFASYRLKSQKDFIGAFPLDGPPKHMDTWRARKRSWPKTDVVDSIWDGDFFVVGKPAVKDATEKVDFCLSYNAAEMKLAESMSSIQKMCLLTIKAYQRCILEEFSEKVTSFHWKTALYWVSESCDNSSLAEDKEGISEEKVEGLLKEVLRYMRTCLYEMDLQHYFIPSNLFADLDKNTRDMIIERINEILRDPVSALRDFFRHEDNSKTSVKTIEFSESQLANLRKTVITDRDEFVVDMIVSALEQFVKEPSNTTCKKPVFKTAVMEVVKTIFTDLEIDIEREGRQLMVPVDILLKTFDNYLSAPESRVQETMVALFTVFSLSGILK